MKLFVLDTHTIYRRGLVACLDLLEDVESVHDAERVRDAWEHPALFECDIVLVDPALPGGNDFVGAVPEATGAKVIVCSSDSGQDAVVGALQKGAVGYLRKDQLTPETLAFITQVERVAGVPVSMIATRFEVRSVIDRRQW